LINIKMVGIDHSKATIEYRELFSFTKATAVAAMQRIRAEFGAAGCVLLSTCNRTELWLSYDTEPAKTPYEILCAVKGASPCDYESYFVERSGRDALCHLLHTSCGMKSKVFGEDQIITQVGEALALSHGCGCADSVLQRLFRTAVTAAKRVKTTVHLTALDTSVATRTVELLASELVSLEGVHCLVIGNGEMGRLTAKALVEQGCDVKMTLRRYKTGDVIIPQGCSVVPYDDRLKELASCRVVVSATTSPHHTIQYDEALPYLDGSPKLLVDLAVPRDISARLSDVQGVQLYDIDSLGGASVTEAENAGVALANGILEEYRDDFENWYYFRELVPKINDISALAALDITGRIYKSIQRLDIDAREQEQLRRLVENASVKVVGKLMFGLRENLDRDKWQDCIQGLEKAVQS